LSYPLYSYIYCPSDVQNPLLSKLCRVVQCNRHAMQEIRNTPFRKSIEVEKVIREDLEAMGFVHSVTNRKMESIFRSGVNFEVDFYHPEIQIAIEVEKGEVNNVWKDIIKFAESPIIQHGVLLVPIIRHEGAVNQSEFYNNTIKKLNNMERIYTMMNSLSIIGY
jgi:hypothetical protein